MLRGYTAKIYPNEAQAELLEKHFGCCRWVYNEMIKINQKKYHRTGKHLSGYDMSAYLPKLKKQYPWLSEVNAASLQIVCHNLSEAYNRFFKKKSMYPKWKKKSSSSSYTVINGGKLCDNYVTLPKVGKVRYRGGDKPNGKLKRITVKKRAGAYYISALYESDISVPQPVNHQSICGIDLGLNDLAVTSYGEKIKPYKAFKASKAKLRAANKRLSRTQKGSNRRKKAILALSKVHEKIGNQRKDYNHKITRALIDDSKNQAFAIESLAVKNMMRNRKLSSHIQDAAWGQFITFLKYKAESVGKRVIEVDRFYPSSKTCSECGIVNDKLALSDRRWVCQECHAEHDRDVNAARNIAFEAVRNTAHGGVVRRGSPLADAVEVRIH